MTLYPVPVRSSLPSESNYKHKKKQASDRCKLERYVQFLSQNKFSILCEILNLGVKNFEVKNGRELQESDYNGYIVVKPSDKMLSMSQEFNPTLTKFPHLENADYFIPKTEEDLDKNSLFLLFPSEAVVDSEGSSNKYWDWYFISKLVKKTSSQSSMGLSTGASLGKRKLSQECVSEDVKNQLLETGDIKPSDLLEKIKKLTVPKISENDFDGMASDALPTKALFLCHYKGNKVAEDTIEYCYADLKITPTGVVKYVFTKDNDEWDKPNINGFYQKLKKRNKDLANLPLIIPVSYDKTAKKSKSS
jgi:hypothetical protein